VIQATIKALEDQTRALVKTITALKDLQANAARTQDNIQLNIQNLKNHVSQYFPWMNLWGGFKKIGGAMKSAGNGIKNAGESGFNAVKNVFRPEAPLTWE